MTDRVITWAGAIPLETDVLRSNKFAMTGIAKLAAAMLGVSTVVNGLAAVPTGPATLTVNVNPGEIYSLVSMDATAYSSVAADTTHQILKSGILLDAVNLSCPAPGTAGQSINYLIEAIYQDSDSDLTTLPYYNASNPPQAWSGPNNSGTPQATTRKGTIALVAKAGAAATTGSQTTPAPDAGYTGLWVVTVANGQTQILAGNITQYAGAPILPSSLLGSIQNGNLSYAVATGTANAHVAAFTPVITARVDGMMLRYKAPAANTGALTLNDGLGAVAVVGANHAALQGGETITNGDALVMWNSSIGGGSYILLECTGGALQIAPATQSQHAVQLGQIPSVFRNRFINGAIQVDQRNQGVAQTITAAASISYTVDRWYAACTGANVTGQQVTGSGPDQFAYKFTGAASVASLLFGQRIKAANSYDMAGTTCSLQAKLSSSTLASVTWTAYYASATDNFSSKTQFATGTFAITSTPTTFNVQMAVPGAAKTGICIEFSVGAFISGTLQFENLQFEAGAAATSFERPPVELVTLMCQHYLPAFNSSSSSDSWALGQCATTTQAQICMPFKIQPRVPPTGMVAVGVASTYYALTNAAAGNIGITAITFGTGTLVQAFLLCTVATGLTAGNATIFTALTTAAQILFTGCEL